MHHNIYQSLPLFPSPNCLAKFKFKFSYLLSGFRKKQRKETKILWRITFWNNIFGLDQMSTGQEIQKRKRIKYRIPRNQFESSTVFSWVHISCFITNKTEKKSFVGSNSSLSISLFCAKLFIFLLLYKQRQHRIRMSFAQEPSNIRNSSITERKLKNLVTNNNSLNNTLLQLEYITKILVCTKPGSLSVTVLFPSALTRMGCYYICVR